MAKHTGSKKSVKTSRFRQLVSTHKVLTVLVCIGLALTAATAIAKYNAYLHKFSDKDYARMERVAGNVLRRVSTGPIDKNKRCRHHAPEKYSSSRLFCSIEMATYLPYESTGHVLQVAHQLEREVNALGPTSSDLSAFSTEPTGTTADIFVRLAKPFPEQSCRFSVETGETVKAISAYLPPKNQDGLIALYFYCSPESREEYFTVIR